MFKPITAAQPESKFTAFSKSTPGKVSPVAGAPKRKLSKRESFINAIASSK